MPCYMDKGDYFTLARYALAGPLDRCNAAGACLSKGAGGRRRCFVASLHRQWRNPQTNVIGRDKSKVVQIAIEDTNDARQPSG